MSPIELMRIVRRWRWVIIPGLLLALGAGAAGYSVTPPRYGQSESYLLLSPVVTEQGRGNPFLQLGNGVGMAASVLATKVSGGETAGVIAAASPGAQYSVHLDPTTSAPVLVATVEGADAAAVTATLDRLGAELVSQLAALQQASGAPSTSWVTISPLTGDTGPTPNSSGALRNGVGAVAVVLLLPLLLVALLERRRRVRAAAQPAEVDAAEGAGRPGAHVSGPGARAARPGVPSAARGVRRPSGSGRVPVGVRRRS
jgi:hypothetical protein